MLELALGTAMTWLGAELFVLFATGVELGVDDGGVFPVESLRVKKGELINGSWGGCAPDKVTLSFDIEPGDRSSRLSEEPRTGC